MTSYLLPLLLLTYGPPNPATETAVGVSFQNEYMHRGEALGPAGLVGLFSFSSPIVNALRLDVSNQTYYQFRGSDFGESVTDISLSRQIGDLPEWRLAAGWRYYDRSNNPASGAFLGDDTSEVWLGIDYLSDFAFWAYYHYDYDRGDGQLRDMVGSYLNVGASKSWRIPNAPAQFDLSGKLGFDAGRGIHTFRDALVHTGLTWKPAYELAVTGGVDWWLPSDQVPGANGLRPVFGAGLTWQKAW